jgi:chromosome partitioning protein
MRSIAFVSEKGGVGKSTSVLNVAACLAQQGKEVLVIDTDPQANASRVLLGGRKPDRPTLGAVLVGQAEPGEAIVPTVIEGVSLLPSEPSLANANNTLAGEVGRERRLRVAMERAGVRFDFALLDTAPTRSLLTTNVLTFAEELLVPIAPGYFGLVGLAQLQSDVDDVRSFLDHRRLRIAGIFLTMVERNKVAKDVEDELRRIFGGLLFNTRIPRNIKLEEAHSRHESILTYAPKSVGAASYLALTEEVLDHGRAEEGDGGDGRHLPAHGAA